MIVLKKINQKWSFSSPLALPSYSTCYSVRILDQPHFCHPHTSLHTDHVSQPRSSTVSLSDNDTVYNNNIKTMHIAVPLQYRAPDSADRILEEVRLVELGRLPVALAERALAQAPHLGLELVRPAGRRLHRLRLAHLLVMTAATVLLLHAVHAQQDLGQRVVVGRHGRRATATTTTAAEREGLPHPRGVARRPRGVGSVVRRRPVRRAYRGPVVAQVMQRRLHAGVVLAHPGRVVLRQAQRAPVLLLLQLMLLLLLLVQLTAAESESTVAHPAGNRRQWRLRGSIEIIRFPTDNNVNKNFYT